MPGEQRLAWPPSCVQGFFKVRRSRVRAAIDVSRAKR